MSLGGSWWTRRLAWIAFGLLWFFWLGYEDRSTLTVMLVAAALAGVLVLEGWARWVRSAGGRRKLARAVVLGAGIGAAVGPLTALLMLLKLSLHAHPIPDFSSQQVWLALKVTPIWALAGALAGAAGWFAGLGSDRPSPEPVAGSEGVEYNKHDRPSGGTAKERAPDQQH